MATKLKRSFVFNIAWAEVLSDYPAEVRLEVYDAIIRYVASGTLSELKPLANMAFSFIKKEIDYNNSRYEETVAKRSEAGKKGMSSRYGKKEEASSLTSVTSDNKTNTCYQDLTKLTNITDNVYDNDMIEKPSIEGAKKSSKFIPPSVEEVRAYVSEKGYHVDPETFVNFYESKGWYVGKNKMKNWHAAVATWQKNETERNGNNRNPYPSKQEANDYALQALRERMEQRRSGLQDELPKPF